MRFQKALLTGATGGLGEALALLLTSKNIPLILVGRNEEKLKELQKKCSHSTIVVADLAKERTAVLKAIQTEKPDLIINNAGFGIYGEAAILPMQDQIDIFEVNAKAVLEITLEGVKTLIGAKKEGVILNISSISSEFTMPLLSVYGASKGFVTQFSKSVDYECQKKGVRVLVSLPGQIDTPFASKAAHREIPQSRWGTISIEKMAKRLWWQIERQKDIDVYDSRYAFSRFISKYLVPEKVSAKFVEKSLRKRL